MGTSVDSSGYYQEVDEARANYGADDDYQREMEQARIDRKTLMVSRYRAADAAEVGATINCPNCGRLIVKNTYQKKFCSNQKNKKTKTGRGSHGIKRSCKDQYWNLINPRGMYAHLNEGY